MALPNIYLTYVIVNGLLEMLRNARHYPLLSFLVHVPAQVYHCRRAQMGHCPLIVWQFPSLQYFIN